MSTKQSLAALKAAFQTPEREQRESLPNNYFPFWNMKPNERAVIRFVKDADDNNPRGFMVEKVFHTLTINGQKKSVPCLSMYGDDCPICKVSQDYYKVKDDVNGKKYWKKKQYIAQALVLEDPLPPGPDGETHVGKIRYIALGYQIYNIIKEAFASDELVDVPYSFEGGYDFIIKKTEQGSYSTYVVGTKFKGAQRPLTDEELSVVEEGMIDLATLLPKNPGIEKVQAMLEADLNGGDVKDDEEEFTPRTKTTTVKPKTTVVEDEDDTPAPSVTKPATKPVAKPADDDEGDDNTQDVDAMLAAIRARRNQKK